MFDELILSLITLLIVIGILFLAYFVTRSLGTKMILGRKKSSIKIIDRIGISQNQTLLLVQIEKQVFFVGAAQHSMTLLTELPEDVAQGIIEKEVYNGKEFEQFSHILNKVKNRKR